ncbi:MAG: hypothetical protein WC341_00425 [Bacteroidales bacterium]|jgi:hypothetical protein
MDTLLRKTISDKFASKADQPKVLYGFVGNTDNSVVVPGKPNYIYVTLADGIVTEAYNNVVPEVYQLPVVLGIDQNQKTSNLLKVLGIRDVPRQKTGTNIGGPPHHASHEWLNPSGSTDITYIQLRQFMPLRPRIIEPFEIGIGGAVLQINGAWTAVGDQTIDMEPYIPTSNVVVSGSQVQALYALVSISALSGSVVVTSGSAMGSFSITTANIPTIPANHFPICAVLLYQNQDRILEARTRTDLIDMRWGMFRNMSVFAQSHVPVSNYYLTGYDAVSGSFSSGSVIVSTHNALNGLNVGDYLHLSAAEKANIIQASGSGSNGWLSSVDWLRFNATSGSGGISDAPVDGNPYWRKDAAWEIATSGSAVAREYVLIQDQKTQNTSGGTFTSGDWRTRTLNTEVSDTANLAALSSNQITLAAGTYEYRITTPGYACDRHQARLYNVTDASVIGVGSSAFGLAASLIATRSEIVGKFTIAAGKALEVQHRCQTTSTTYGFGVEANLTTEVYTIAEFWKVG